MKAPKTFNQIKNQKQKLDCGEVPSKQILNMLYIEGRNGLKVAPMHGYQEVGGPNPANSSNFFRSRNKQIAE